MQRRCEHAATTTARRSGYGGRTSEAHAPLAKAGGQVAGARPGRRGRRGGPQDNGGKGSGCCVPRRTRTVPAEIRPTSGPPAIGPSSVRESLGPTPTDRRHSAILGGHIDRGAGRTSHMMRRYIAVWGKAVGPNARRPRTGCRTGSAIGPRTARKAGYASRTGPPPAGNEAAASPSPLSPVQWADPRSTHGSALSTAGQQRTAGRTATRQEHEGSSPRRVRSGIPAGPQGDRIVTAGSLPVRLVSAGRPPRAPLPPLVPSRLPPSRRTPSTVRTGPSARATIPPYGRLPLNGRDAANYAGFTEVLGRRHIPRGSATCLCGRSAEVRPWGGHGTNAARLDG